MASLWRSVISFSSAGEWGVQVTSQRAGGVAQQARANFTVLEKGAAPTIGGQAPKSNSPILSDVGGDGTKLCTNAPPCDLHALRIKDALGAG